MDRTNKWQTIVNEYENFKELLSVKYLHYILDHSSIINDENKLKTIEQFLTWLVEDIDKDINIPRGKDKKSYKERAQIES